MDDVNSSYALFNGSSVSTTAFPWLPTTSNDSVNATVGSSDGNHFKISTTGKILMYIVYTLVFCFGLLGNGIVIYIVGIKTKVMTSSETLMTSLAVADFLASFFIPVVMIYDLAIEAWHLGTVMCKILPSFNNLTLMASTWSLVLIALDRCRVILNPFHARLSRLKRAFYIAAVWSIAFWVTFPYSYVLEVIDELCWDHWQTPTDQFIYFTVFEALICVVPTVIMGSAYAVSAYVLHQNKLLHAGNSTMLKRIKQNKRVTQMFAFVVMVFFTLTTPYLVNAFALTYYAAFDFETYVRHVNVLFTLNYGLFTLSAINSCVNPFIYAKMHAGIRRSLHRAWIRVYPLLCCNASPRGMYGMRRRFTEMTTRGTVMGRINPSLSPQVYTRHTTVHRQPQCTDL